MSNLNSIFTLISKEITRLDEKFTKKIIQILQMHGNIKLIISFHETNADAEILVV